MFCSRLYIASLLLILTACGHEAPLFIELDPSRSEVKFINTVEDNDKLNILDYLYFYNGAGVAAGDVNNDGLSIFFCFKPRQKQALFE